MSESTSTGTPAAPAPAADAPASAPPASSQPGISVSEAARLLNQQRKQAPAQPGVTRPNLAQPAEATRKPSPNEVAAQAAAKPAEAPAPKGAPPAPDGLSALDRALGVPGTPGEAAAAPATDTAPAIEIEGQRYSTAQIREAVLKAADYTQKMQGLAEGRRQNEEGRRQLEAQQQALAAVLPYIQPELAKLHELVGQQAQKPDIGLMQSDPQRYFVELHRYEQVRAEQERLGGLTRIQAEAAERATAQQVAAGHEQLAREFPFWADARERAAAQAQIAEWATTKGGFSREELRGLSDPRALKLMMKAAQFDKWVSGTRTSAPAQTTRTPVRGTPPPPAPTERVSVASEAFEAKPSIRSGAALLAARRANTTNGAGRR